MTVQRQIDNARFTTYTTPIQDLGRTALVSGALSLLPVFAACLWLTAASSAWPAVALGEIVVTAVFFAVYIRFRLVYAGVTPTHLVKRRMVLGPVSVDRADVDHVVINRVYRGSSTDALPVMLVLDHAGHRLYGMNGLFWSHDDITTIAEALDVQVIEDDCPLSRGEYYEMYPMARGWYATRLFRLATVGAAGIALASVLASMQSLAN